MSEPTTVEELQAALDRRSRHSVGRLGDPELRVNEGNSAVRVLPDGRAEVITFGRGSDDDDVETFESEAAAVRELARGLLQPSPPSRSAREDAADAKRMQAVAREVLDQLRRRGGAE